jgi:hypothetical protein
MTYDNDKPSDLDERINLDDEPWTSPTPPAEEGRELGLPVPAETGPSQTRRESKREPDQ